MESGRLEICFSIGLSSRVCAMLNVVSDQQFLLIRADTNAVNKNY
jgi:hypothetical protein